MQHLKAIFGGGVGGERGVGICFCAHTYEQGAGSSQCDRTYIRVLISNDMQIREL